MSINITRFYKREKLNLGCEIITPMFLGNANQEAELRAAPFKGLLRYWWRVANGWQYQNSAELLKKENDIFGSPDEEDGGKSQVTVETRPLTAMTPRNNNFKSPGNVAHPECEKAHYKTDPLNYLAGMGLIHFKKGIQHSYFDPGERFELVITASQQVMNDLQSTLAAFALLGSIGSRSRNGWGSFRITNQQITASLNVRDFTAALDRDYPHCFGKDGKGPLYWQTKLTHHDWGNCMKDLAASYIALRAGDDQSSIPKLEVNSGAPPDRHLLGYPVTNHTVKPIMRNGQVDRTHPENSWRSKWGNQGRHGSALRLIVRKEVDGRHRGYFLHLPHLFSTEMWPNGKERQIAVWKQVHATLDRLCNRVNLQEARP